MLEQQEWNKQSVRLTCTSITALHPVPHTLPTSVLDSRQYRSPAMRLPIPDQTLLLLSLIASTAHAQSVIEDLSFGHTTPLSTNGQQIHGWHVGFAGPAPPILSDRIILTPPHPGHMRAGLWAESPMTTDSFTADFNFRASGPERGSGNLQIWYTKESTPASELRSVYTVDRFEGLAINIDQYAGSGGSIRGFLNDGTVDYKSHHNVDSLAFGHCYYSYRNLGRWSNIKVKSDAQGLEVMMDDRTCFKSNMVGRNISTGRRPRRNPSPRRILTVWHPDQTPLKLPLRHHSRLRRNTRQLRSQQIRRLDHQAPTAKPAPRSDATIAARLLLPTTIRRPTTATVLHRLLRLQLRLRHQHATPRAP